MLRPRGSGFDHYAEMVRMSEQALQPLDYAAPTSIRDPVPQFRTVAFSFALLGIAANLAIVALLVPAMHSAAWVHRDLVKNPRAYGREVSPATIASLRRPLRLWTSMGLMFVAAAFGLMLAVNLLCATVQLHRNPLRASHRLWAYRRLKPIGAMITTLAFLWFGGEQHAFWVAATRHWPVGSSAAPWLEGVILFGCAWLPAWWVRNRGGVATNP